MGCLCYAVSAIAADQRSGVLVLAVSAIVATTSVNQGSGVRCQGSGVVLAVTESISDIPKKDLSH